MNKYILILGYISTFILGTAILQYFILQTSIALAYIIRILFLFSVFGSLLFCFRNFSFLNFKKNRSQILPKFLLTLISIILFYIFSRKWLVYPLGAWDSVAMWNYKAYFYSIAPFYQSNFNLTPVQFVYHPEYPPIYPLFVSFFLSFSKDYLYFVPIIFSSILYISMVVAIVFRAKIKFNLYGIILFLLITLGFLNIHIYLMLTELYADLLLSFILFLIFAFFQFDYQNLRTQIILFILPLGMLPFIKNEGIILSIFIVGSLAFVNLLVKFKNKFLRNNLILGISVIVLIVLPLKYYHSSFLTTDFINQDSLSITDQLWKSFQKNNPKLIMKFIEDYLFNYTNKVYILASIFILLYGNSKNRIMLFLFFILQIIYFSIYLFTASDLEWHLGTSFNRINTQLYLPYLYFLASINYEFNRLEI